MLIDDDKQTRIARRNLMIVSMTSIVFGLGAVVLDSTETFFLIPVKLGSPISLQVIMLGLIIYFSWRYWASFDGDSPYTLIHNNVNTVVREDNTAAHGYFTGRHGLVYEEDWLGYRLERAGVHHIAPRFSGFHRINKPVFVLWEPHEQDSDSSEIDELPTKTSEWFYVPEDDEIRRAYRKAFFSRALHHSDFLEFIGPLLVAFIAFLIVVCRLSYSSVTTLATWPPLNHLLFL